MDREQQIIEDCSTVSKSVDEHISVDLRSAWGRIDALLTGKDLTIDQYLVKAEKSHLLKAIDIIEDLREQKDVDNRRLVEAISSIEELIHMALSVNGEHQP
jgi:hypothetical protein